MKTRILLMFLCMLAGIQMRAADGDSFTATTAEGIEMTFVITSEEKLTAKVGDGKNPAIDIASEGSLTVPETVENNDKTYSVTAISAYAFNGCSQLTSVSLPESIGSIGGYAFNNCSSLISINIPSKVKSIGNHTFYGCSGLKDIELPEGLTTILQYGLAKTAIKSIIIPSTVSSIGSYAIASCKQLTKVISRVETPFKFGSKAFDGIYKTCALHVPIGTKNEYINNGWTTSVFPGGVVEGENTPVIGDSFTVTDENGATISYTLTNLDNLSVNVGDGINCALSANYTGVLNIYSAVTYEGQEYQIKSIAANAIKNCTGITELNIYEGITQIGNYAFSDCSSLKTVNLPLSLNSIGSYAFNNCSAMTAINIPENIKSIGNHTFYNCSSLTEIELPNELTTIAQYGLAKTGLSTIIIPSSVSSIGTYAFASSKNLKKVISRIENPFSFGSKAFDGISTNCALHVPIGTKSEYINNGWTTTIFPGGVVEGENTAVVGDTFVMPNADGINILYVVTDVVNGLNVSIGNGKVAAIETTIGKLEIPSTVDYEGQTYHVTSLSANSFNGCDGLTNVLLPEGIINIGNYSFNECSSLLTIDLPSSLSTIGAYAFDKCISLESVELPNSLNSIGNYAFNGCTKLKDIIIPELVTNIGTNAFRDCSELQSAFILCQVSTLKEGMFRSCKSLSKISLPESLISIANYVFWECSSLKNIDLPETCITLGQGVFAFSGLESIVLPEGITTLDVALFADCYYLASVNIPSTVTTIKKEVFRHNLSLPSIEIPEGVTSIAYLAFYDCQKLTEIILPSTLTSMGTYVFYGDVKLTKVIARMEDPFKLPEHVFDECPSNISLHIPDGTYDKYAAAGWVPEIFPGGIVYGDDTPTLNETFTFTTIEGVEVTAVLTDIEKKSIQVGLGTSGNPAIDQATQGIVTLPDTVEAFGQKYVITTIGGYAFRYCNDVTEVKIPATVTHFGRYGFGNMDNLEKAVLPDSLIAMETAAFYRDAKLSELKLNEGLQDIGNYSFSYAAISELEIPKSVTNIGRSSFAACENLDKVISRIEVPFAFQSDAFTGISSTCGLHVPEGTKEAYIEQGWTEETFPGGIVYGDETLHKGQTFDTTEEDGTKKTFKVADVNEMKAEMVSVKAGSEAGGTVTLMPTATHELTGNVYTVSSIADKAFGADVKKVLSRIETPFAVSSAAFASLSPMCSLHVPAGTKAAYLEQGWTEESFKAGVVEGDDTLVKGQTFTLTDEDGTSTTYRVTDVNDNLVEIVSAKEGEEADGRVNIQQAVTDPVAGNDYTVGSIGNGAFKEELKAVTAEAETPYPVMPEAFKGIGDKCVLFVPVGTKDAYIENGWTEDIFKGGIYEGNIPGDVNEDLAVDISDIVAVINTIADPENSTYRYADVNEDGKVDISDIVKIINIIAE